MIQRIQTIYLFVLTALMAAVLFTPLARFLGGTEEFRLMAFGVKSLGEPAGLGVDSPYVASTLYMGILVALSTLLPLVNIFLYKRRWLQMRLCVVEIVLLIGVQIFVCYYIFKAWRSVSGLEIHSVSYSLVDVFPLIGIVLAYMAMRGIIKDETLVRSLDRIR